MSRDRDLESYKVFLYMADNKKTFIFYSDWINMVREMPDQDAGELLKHILSYVNDESPETKNLLVKVVFGHMKPLLKTDLKRWESIREKRRKAGKKGGKANAKQNKANAKQVQAVNDNDNVNDNVNDNNNVNVIDKNEKINFSEVVRLYNEICFQLPKVIKVTESRKKAIRARAKQHGLKTIGEVFQKAAASDFMRGANKSNWTASFDWIFNATNFIKILEGNYDNKKTTTNNGSKYSDDFKEQLIKDLQS